MAKKSVLITGGAGFIGSHLSDQLLAADYRVRALADWLRTQVAVDGVEKMRAELESRGLTV